MAPCAQTGSGRLSRGLLLLWALLGTGLCHVGAEAESFGQDARTSPPVAVNWTAQLVEEMYTNITQKCWEFFVDLMRNVTVSELCEWKVISRAPRLCLWATSSRFQGPRATFPSGSSSWCGQWVQDKLLGATRRVSVPGVSCPVPTCPLPAPRCSVPRPYSLLQACLEGWADHLRYGYPNALAEQYIFRSHRRYFHNCTLQHQVFDPPQDVLLPMIIAPICLIPFLVTLVIWRSKDGKAQA